MRGTRLALAAFVLAVVAAATVKIRSYDLFWHLEAGQWIVAHRAMPRTDPFRYTAEGMPWADHEWLSQVLMALGERAGGLAGLGVLQSLFVLALAGLLLFSLRRMRVPWPEAILIVLAAVLLARRRFLLQPELATFAGVALLLALLEELRRRARAGPAIAAVLLTAVWANLHPGALAAPAVALLYVGGLALAAHRGGARAGGRALEVDSGSSPSRAGQSLPPRALWLLPLALLVVLLATPNGVEIFSVPGRISAALEGLPVTNPEWEPLWRSPQPAFLMALAAVAGIVAWRWRRDGILDLATLLPVAALGALTVESVRQQSLFFLAAPFALGRPLASERGSRLGPRGAAMAAAICLAGAAWCVLPPQRGPLRQRSEPIRFGWGLTPDRYPERAVDAIAAWPELGRIYNEDRFGGYLLWRLFPERQIFLDGRNELDPELLREVTTSWSVAPRWHALLDRFRIDGALLHYTPRRFKVVAGDPASGATTEERTRSALLFPRSDFALVHWDDVAMLFVRRTEERAGILADREYRFVDPEDLPRTLERATRDPAFHASALAELERKLDDDPTCERAASLAEKMR